MEYLHMKNMTEKSIGMNERPPLNKCLGLPMYMADVRLDVQGL